MPIIAEADTEDRSKGDLLSKLVAILQLVWLIIQFIARYVQNLPVTPLELDTLGRPHIVHWNSGATTPPPHDSLANNKKYRVLLILRSLLSDQSSSLARKKVIITIIGGISGMLFGGIHCLDWNFVFPRPIEQTLWRMASIWIAYSFGVFLLSYFQEWPVDTL
ncbi:uncharacterized protein BJ212DRAFT_1328119 [Suillus subaureus]|uniref:Uncharacterized protein n=1 Tax=Suillus subaureus TaxID=48587 RepID=A0A9P7EHX1_9AGAM|nr:uncharacterized protein BJ212DRAFT_1328119 [Suillus subaureus]KAG1822481.1 hypothetical protein BJ212DRAFT_1328119 [Suillus subaureus]